MGRLLSADESTGPKKLTLKELVDCPLVMKGGGRLEKVLMSLGYRINVALRCEASSTVKAAVRMGMGVGILYQNAVATRVAKGDLRLLNVPELKEMGIKSSIIYDRRKLLTPIAQNFSGCFEKKEFYDPVHEPPARIRSLSLQ